MNFFDFEIKDLAGNTVDLTRFKGKKLLIVNTASECGFTYQYANLEEMYEEFEESNFSIIGFPCNDFGAQEPGTAEEIEQFCQVNYGVTFPLTGKINITSEPKNDLFQWLEKESGVEVKWNFFKFLIDEEGKVVKGFSSSILPNDPEIIDWIMG